MRQTTMAQDGTFRSAYCDRYGVSEESFTRHLFWRCLPASRRPLARLVLLISPNYFKVEWDAVNAMGLRESAAELRVNYARLRARNQKEGRRLKNLLGLRLSGRRLFAIQRALLESSSANA